MIRGAVLIAAAVTALLVLGGCSGGDAAVPGPTRTPRAAATHTAEPTSTPTPTPTASYPPVTQPVAQTVGAGTVSAGVSATTSSSGPANVTYQRQGDFAVVVDLDCSACTGTATVTAAGRMSPFGSGTAPLHGSFLMSIFKDDPVDQSLIVDAQGRWTVTLRSWNDLPTVSGPQSGTGPAVLFFSDDVSRVHVDFTPAGPDDSFGGRVFTTSDHPQLFGDSDAFSKDYDADLPGVMAIQTNGTWTVTPLH